jgi:hypothetical protein
MDPLRDPLFQPGGYFRRKAAEARETAESVTTKPLRERLLDTARYFDRLAEGAESIPAEPLGSAG